MQKAYRFILDNKKKPRKRFTCPGCGKLKVFVRYINTKTGEYLPNEYGKCNRDNNCTYWLNPYKDGYSERTKDPENFNNRKFKPPIKFIPDRVSFIPIEIFKQSLNKYEHNHFANYLINLFGSHTATKLIERYYIGTSNHWSGATVFWQVDISGRIRTGKVMLYNQETGKRIKEPSNHIHWAHSLLQLSDFNNLKQCFFGEHLLKDEPNKPIAIAESEKTAIIASIYLPHFIWLSCGGLNMLSEERCKVLKGRNVTLYPDLNGFEKWSAKAKELSDITRFTVSDLLEINASETERKQGLDIADYLIKFNAKPMSLKDLFKAKFLKGILPEYQLQVWHDYQRRGLSPFDAKEVTNELINEHGFIVVAD